MEDMVSAWIMSVTTIALAILQKHVEEWIEIQFTRIKYQTEHTFQLKVNQLDF